MSPKEQLKSAVCLLLQNKNIAFDSAVAATIPRRWELFDDLVLLPKSSFRSSAFSTLEPELWDLVAAVFHVSCVARHGRIQSDDFRSPTLEMLRGTETWVRKKDNGVIYELDLAKSMFSSGNITEKVRMSKLPCSGELIVDLFAGIGYFTIPLLKAGAEKVIACEWNPDAIVALRRNLASNKVEERCEVLFGDNREVAPVGVADRVLLGLIPSSEMSWVAACRCLKPASGGVLHVHANVETTTGICEDLGDISAELNDFYGVSLGKDVIVKKPQFRVYAYFLMKNLVDNCYDIHGTKWFAQLHHFECVKSYGPKIFHCVFDVILRPSVIGVQLDV